MKLIVICGATATGKSDLAISVAQRGQFVTWSLLDLRMLEVLTIRRWRFLRLVSESLLSILEAIFGRSKVILRRPWLRVGFQ